MSSGFYSDVERLFDLLDMDGNKRLDRQEARLGLTSCFNDVHRPSEDLDGNPDAIVENQVNWLFSATEHTDLNAEISIAEFKACYQKLLAAAYEEEVLALDLKRAIDSLNKSKDWSDMRQLFRTLRDTLTALKVDALNISSTSQHKSVLDQLFIGITGKSNVLGPKKLTAARKVVAAFTEKAAAQTIGVNDLIKIEKEILAMHIPIEVLKKGADEALAVANGTAAASSASASSSSTPPAPAVN